MIHAIAMSLDAIAMALMRPVGLDGQPGERRTRPAGTASREGVGT